MPACPSWPAALLLLLFVSGCSVISKDLRMKASPLLTPKQVLVNPAFYAGETVIWGGHILENQAGREETRLIILQTPLSLLQLPQSREETQGRFIAVEDQYLDPAVYSEDRLVTVGGQLTGDTVRLPDDRYGPYPVIRLQEIHLWRQHRRFHPSYDVYPWRHYPYHYDVYPWYRTPYYYGPSFHFLLGIESRESPRGAHSPR